MHIDIETGKSDNPYDAELSETDSVPSSRTQIGFSDLAGARVLVTGARGFIGTELCSRLGALGAEVYGTSRVQRVQSADVAPHMRWIVTMLDDPQQVRKLLSSVKPSVIFHLAGPTSADRSLAMVLPTFQGTLGTTVNLLIAAAETGCRRIVLAGSLEAPPGDGWSVHSPYAAAKRACHMYAQMFSELYATPITVARIFMTYGPKQRDTRKLVPYVILSLLRGNVPKLGSGDRAVDLHRRCGRGLASNRGNAGARRRLGGSWNRAHTHGSLGCRSARRDHREPRHAGIRWTCGSTLEVIAKADLADTEAKIGWVPRTLIEDGLKTTVETYRAVLLDANESLR